MQNVSAENFLPKYEKLIEEYYRRLEREVLQDVLKDGAPMVLATGAGSLAGNSKANADSSEAASWATSTATSGCWRS